MALNPNESGAREALPVNLWVLYGLSQFLRLLDGLALVETMQTTGSSGFMRWLNRNKRTEEAYLVKRGAGRYNAFER